MSAPANILNAQPVNISKVKEVITVAGFKFVALLEEETETEYIFRDPFVLQEMVNPMTQQLALSFAPLSIFNPFLTVRLKKDIVLAVNNIPQEVEQKYYEIKLQLNSASAAAQSSQQNPLDNRIIKP